MSDASVVWKLRADIAAALLAQAGTAVPGVAQPFAPGANINMRDFGPRTFPKFKVLDDDEIAKSLSSDAMVLIDSVSIIATGRAEKTEQGISQFSLPDVSSFSTGLGADAASGGGGLDTGDGLDSANANAPALTITTDPTTNISTIGGAIKAGDVIGGQSGTVGASYLVQSTDTFATVAAGLAAALTAVGIEVSASGATLLPPSGVPPLYRIGTTFTANVERFREQRVFECVLRCTNKADREIVGAIVATIYDPNGTNCWLDLADDAQATILNIDAVDAPRPEFVGDANTTVWLRTISFTVEYPVVQPVQFTTVVAVNVGIVGSAAAPDWWPPTPASQL